MSILVGLDIRHCIIAGELLPCRRIKLRQVWGLFALNGRVTVYNVESRHAKPKLGLGQATLDVDSSIP